MLSLPLRTLDRLEAREAQRDRAGVEGKDMTGERRDVMQLKVEMDFVDGSGGREARQRTSPMWRVREVGTCIG